jgi:hypothetical protein
MARKTRNYPETLGSHYRGRQPFDVPCFWLFFSRHSFKRLVLDSNHNKRRVFRAIRIAPRPIGFAKCKASKVHGLDHVAFARHRRQRGMFCYSHTGTIGNQWRRLSNI